jgi:hypothetical protein
MMPTGERESGRRTFDKTVSSKPLAFAVDAGPYGYSMPVWYAGTGLEGAFAVWRDRPSGGLITGARPNIVGILEVLPGMGWGEASTGTRLALAAQQDELWTFVEARLRTVN